MLGGGSLPHFFIATMGSYFFIYIAKAGIILLLMFCLNIPVKGSILDFFIVNYGQNLVGLSYGGCLCPHSVVFSMTDFFVFIHKSQFRFTFGNDVQSGVRSDIYGDSIICVFRRSSR